MKKKRNNARRRKKKKKTAKAGTDKNKKITDKAVIVDKVEVVKHEEKTVEKPKRIKYNATLIGADLMHDKKLLSRYMSFLNTYHCFKGGKYKGKKVYVSEELLKSDLRLYMFVVKCVYDLGGTLEQKKNKSDVIIYLRNYEHTLGSRANSNCVKYKGVNAKIKVLKHTYVFIEELGFKRSTAYNYIENNLTVDGKLIDICREYEKKE